jgi:uncharacterized FlgJ-related protein|tara:strand:- start:3759 stop:4070 length:312 start_codon:yes stop_codon:yes gene_type:complete
MSNGGNKLWCKIFRHPIYGQILVQKISESDSDGSDFARKVSLTIEPTAVDIPIRDVANMTVGPAFSDSDKGKKMQEIFFNEVTEAMAIDMIDEAIEQLRDFTS